MLGVNKITSSDFTVVRADAAEHRGQPGAGLRRLHGSRRKPDRTIVSPSRTRTTMSASLIRSTGNVSPSTDFDCPPLTHRSVKTLNCTRPSAEICAVTVSVSPSSTGPGFVVRCRPSVLRHARRRLEVHGLGADAHDRRLVVHRHDLRRGKHRDRPLLRDRLHQCLDVGDGQTGGAVAIRRPGSSAGPHGHRLPVDRRAAIRSPNETSKTRATIRTWRMARNCTASTYTPTWSSRSEKSVTCTSPAARSTCRRPDAESNSLHAFRKLVERSDSDGRRQARRGNPRRRPRRYFECRAATFGARSEIHVEQARRCPVRKHADEVPCTS